MPYLKIEEENKVSKNLNENYSYQQAKVLAKNEVTKILRKEYDCDAVLLEASFENEYKILLDAVAEIYGGVQESPDGSWHYKSRYLEKSKNNSNSSYSKIRVWDLARKEAEKARTNKLGVGEKLTSGEQEQAIKEIIKSIFKINRDNGVYDINRNSAFLHTSGTLSSAEYGEILKNLFGNVRISEMSERQRELLEKYLKEAAISLPTVTDPLLIDLNGDGIKTTNVNEDLKFFDHENDGFAEMTSWADTNDGVLFYDKNNNGIIDNGSELFGENYIKSNGQKATDGFDALADLDSNNDGVIDANDEHFADIKIEKGDGTQMTLAEAGITSINLNASTVNQTDENGNTKILSATFVKSDGTSGELGSFDLRTSNLISIADDSISEDILNLPNIQGSAHICNLQEAMAKSNSLKTLVQNFINPETPEAQRSQILDQILLEWTGSENVLASSRGEFVNAQHLSIVEALTDRSFYSSYEESQENEHPENPNQRAGDLIESAYAKLKADTYSQLVSQSLISDLCDLVAFNDDGTYNFSDVITKLKQEIEIDETAGKSRVLQFAKMIKSSSDSISSLFDPFDDDCFYTTFTKDDRELKWQIDSFGKVQLLQPNTGEYNDNTATAGDDAYFMDYTYGNYMRSLSGSDTIYGGNQNDIIETCSGGNLIDGGDGDDYLRGQDDKDIIFGGNGNDTIKGEAGDDILFGGDGDDTIYGDDTYKFNVTNNDIIRGGKGNDVIFSKYGNDTFIFDRGDGQDTIIESEGVDTLFFGNDISWEDLQFTRNGDNMVITLLKDGEATQDKITISDWFKNYKGDNTYRFKNQKIEYFEFKDGSVHQMNEIPLEQDSQMAFIYNMDENREVETAENFNSIVNLANAYNNVIIGANSSNIINFDNSDIHAIIVNPTSNDTVVFGENFSLENTIFKLKENTLEISFKNTSGSLIIEYFGSPNINFQYSNGTTISDFTPYLSETFTYEDITLPDNINDVTLAGSTNISVVGNDNDNTITGNSGDNTYETKGGLDKIYDLEGGNDTYIYNLGDGKTIIYDHNGSDKIVLGEGISPSDLYLTRDNNNSNSLCIEFDGHPNDIIIIDKFFEEGYQIESIQFADGTIITDLSNRLKQIIDNKDISISGNNTLISALLEGEDHCSIVGNDSNNYFRGNYGDNSYTGGLGNDTIRDEFKTNERYYYNLGDGNDSIIELGGVDSIIFGEGITPDMIGMSRNENSLCINFNNHDGLLLLQDYFLSDEHKVELLKFADGTVIDNFEAYLSGVGSQQGSIVMDSDQINATLTGSGDAIVQGNSLDNTIIGNSGNNIYAASAGNDTITDIEGGNDTYLYNVNNGYDTITDLGGTDTIKFGLNISPNELIFKQNQYNLEITFNNREGGITILNYFLNDNYKIENLKFEDGTVINDVSNLLTQVTVFENFTLPEESIIDTVIAGNAEISIVGNSNNNTFIGSANNNTYQGKGGNDTIVDTEGGNDTYIYNLGDGLDTITDMDGNDTIQFGEGITIQDLKFVKADNNLQIWISGNQNEGLIINNFFTKDENDSYRYKIENFKFADGSTITDITSYINTEASENDLTLSEGITEGLLLGNNNSSLTGNSADNVIYGNSGDNTIQAGAGNDTIYNISSNSNDTYVYNLGDGHDVIEDIGGHNKLIFGTGINGNNLSALRKDNDIIFRITNDSEIVGSITIKNAYCDNYGTIDSVYITDLQQEYGTLQDTFVSFGSDNSINNFEGKYNDLYLFGNNNSSIIGSHGNKEEHMYGNSGNNTYQGNGGNDTIIDTEGGDDTYIYNIGDGIDTITDFGGNDTIQFGEGISASDVIFTKHDNNLSITFKNNIQGEIWVNNFFNSDNGYKIENFKFADNTCLTDITQYITGIDVDSDYTITEDSSITDVYLSGNGNISVNGNSKDNRFFGNSGNNTYQGNGGNDTISDTEGGDDTYIYNLGDGYDIITDIGGNDTIRLGEGITANMIHMKRLRNNNLIIYFENQDGQIDIQNYFDESNNCKIEKIILADNTEITNFENYMDPLTFITIDSDYTIAENSSITDVYLSESGNISATGNSKNNHFEDNSGDNTFEGKGGDDGFYCTAGGNDTYIFNVGDGWDWITDEGGSDRILFGPTVSLDKTEFRRSGNNLQIVVNDGTTWSGIFINDQFDTNKSRAIEKFEFSDGTVITDLTNYITGISVSEDYTLPENSTIEKIYLSGSENISAVGNSQNNYFEDNSGDNTFEGKGGDDGFYCAAGGNDTYIFNVGDGWDWIIDEGGSDRILFGPSVSLDNIEFRRSGNNLQIVVNDGTTWSGIFINDQFDPNKSRAIEKFEFSDGTVITDLTNLLVDSNSDEDVNMIIQEMNSYSPDEDFVLSSFDKQDTQDLTLVMAN
ncbi:MAG: hypothetical protein DKM22_04595 [Candidatus Melainabacteria bacterium]|nr:MAG: hypothetical protein DKM22_04595 [Candidatus Melainabacteria bacterium]